MKIRKIVTVGTATIMLITSLAVGSVNETDKPKTSIKISDVSQSKTPVVAVCESPVSESEKSIEEITSLENESINNQKEENRKNISKNQAQNSNEIKSMPSAEEETLTGGSSYVGDANTDTGISWDGKSPIIYTYKDGTTGTQKQDGATYEAAPGLTRIYMSPDEIQWDGTCSQCGKVAGEGTNETCIRWLMLDMTCPNCKEFVKQYECHTCKIGE